MLKYKRKISQKFAKFFLLNSEYLIVLHRYVCYNVVIVLMNISTKECFYEE